MSYDLFLFRVPPDGDLEKGIDAALGGEEEETAPAPLDPEKERRKRALAEALMAHDPGLAVFPFDHAEIAREEEITVDEARLRWRHLELHGADGESGILIALNDDTVDITLPFWHQGSDADAVWSKVWGYLRVLEREGGMRAYDPQLGRVLDLDADRREVLAPYARGAEVLRRVIEEEDAPRRPWWKFW